VAVPVVASVVIVALVPAGVVGVDVVGAAVVGVAAVDVAVVEVAAVGVVVVLVVDVVTIPLQSLPVNPEEQLHENIPEPWLRHVAPFLHGKESHASTSISQLAPVYPGLQRQLVELTSAHHPSFKQYTSKH